MKSESLKTKDSFSLKSLFPVRSIPSIPVAKIRHELFELSIVPVELFVRGGSSQQMIDSISNGTPAMPPARLYMPARIEFPKPFFLIKFFAQCVPNFNHLPLRFNASDSVGI
jgi:hypothetical protein